MLCLRILLIHTGLQPGVRHDAAAETVSTVFLAFAIETVKTVSLPWQRLSPG